MQGLDSSCVSYVDTTLMKKEIFQIKKKKEKTEDRKKNGMNINFKPIKNSVVINTDICTP